MPTSPSHGDLRSRQQEPPRAPLRTERKGLGAPAALDDPDLDAEGDAAPVTFANPFANTFLETKQLDREGQRTFYDMIKSYEEIKSRDDLHMVKCNSEEEHNTMRAHHVKRRRVNMHEDEEPEYEYYVAPLYKIYEFGFAIKSMQKDPVNNSIEPIRQDLAGMKRTLDELQSSDKSTVEEVKSTVEELINFKAVDTK
ncbi:hypothetical protein A4X09_0g4044 [Tilletia walkeri]|uniref:Uncharacterized protein n=1 Tax=Tilletia walkeri TaxID=117179 RepID=A0A8X7N6V7_9BASI|nr:hypothetical protein A4X09_0g4044 [Tilletia walkeri]